MRRGSRVLVLTWTNVEAQLIQAVLAVLGMTVTSLITYFTPRLIRLVDSHIQAKHAALANDVLRGLSVIAESVVHQFNQNVVDSAKASGTFTASLGASVKRDAIQAVLSQSSALTNLGAQTLGDIETLVSSMIEHAVVGSKESRAGQQNNRSGIGASPLPLHVRTPVVPLEPDSP